MSDAIVIGGGFSGAMTAAHLAARGVAVSVIEPGALGRGVAYANVRPELLLNTPARAMSALADRPDHFVDYLARRGSSVTFAPRHIYGDYLGETIAELAGQSLDHISARAVAIRRAERGFAIDCDDGTVRRARRVVLALGNPSPRTPDAFADRPSEYWPDPYRAIAELPADASSIALLGTGLTALDVIVGLRARGHRGRIVAISRRGLVPSSHDRAQPTTIPTMPRELLRQPSVRTLIAWWRSRIERDISPAAIVAALRPHLPALWRRLPIAERAKFTRHVRPHWDVLRHRAPPSVRALVELGRAEGWLETIADRVVSVARVRAGMRLQLERSAIAAGYVINCTGPERDVRRIESPLVKSLLACGMIASDPLGLGVSCGRNGELGDGAYVVGPWRVADDWEATAVPELRVHAAETASAIATSLDLAAA